MSDPNQVAQQSVIGNIYTNNAGKITGAVLASTLMAILGAVTYSQFGQNPYVPTLDYPNAPITNLELKVGGTLVTPLATNDPVAIFQKISSAPGPGNNSATYTSIIKTNSDTNSSVIGGAFEAADRAGGGFIEGIDARAYAQHNGASMGNTLVAGTDAGVTTFINLLGSEGFLYNNIGTDSPTFGTFNPNHQATAFIASNGGTTKSDAAFVVNANNNKPFRTGIIVTGSGLGYGIGVDDTAIATLGNMPVGINFGASVFATAAIITPGFTVGPNGDVAAASLKGILFTPSSSTATCTPGQFYDDANYHYVCTATNTFKRVALSAF